MDAIRSKGYNAFVLKYRVGKGGTVATEDLAAALSWIFRNAATLEVCAKGYSLWGSSAGARMAAFIGSHGAVKYGGGVPKPLTVVMAYTAHSDYSSAEPPTFALIGEQDAIVPPASVEGRVQALRRSGTAVEFRKYRNLGHSFGLGTGTIAEGWIFEAIPVLGECNLQVFRAAREVDQAARGVDLPGCVVRHPPTAVCPERNASVRDLTHDEISRQEIPLNRFPKKPWMAPARGTQCKSDD